MEVISTNTADIMKALSEESRIRIVSLLTQRELCVCEMEAILQLSQSYVSRHLLKLKQAGIVTAQREAQWVHYRLGDEFVKRNGNLIYYLEDAAKQDSVCVSDQAKLQRYMKSGMNCEQLMEQARIDKDLNLAGQASGDQVIAGQHEKGKTPYEEVSK